MHSPIQISSVRHCVHSTSVVSICLSPMMMLMMDHICFFQKWGISSVPKWWKSSMSNQLPVCKIMSATPKCVMLKMLSSDAWRRHATVINKFCELKLFTFACCWFRCLWSFQTFFLFPKLKLFSFLVSSVACGGCQTFLLFSASGPSDFWHCREQIFVTTSSFEDDKRVESDKVVTGLRKQECSLNCMPLPCFVDQRRDQSWSTFAVTFSNSFDTQNSFVVWCAECVEQSLVWDHLCGVQNMWNNVLSESEISGHQQKWEQMAGQISMMCDWRQQEEWFLTNLCWQFVSFTMPSSLANLAMQLFDCILFLFRS